MNSLFAFAYLTELPDNPPRMDLGEEKIHIRIVQNIQFNASKSQHGIKAETG